jgi:8-oxo-dGTP pyrophosphatase MutT (NUDIX family)
VPENPWRTKRSEIVYENAWIRVREDQVVRPDGGDGIYGVVEIRPSIAVVALNDRDEIALVGQWRYALNRHSLEVPRGGSHPGETDMVEVAQRELAEEVGVVAKHWEALGAVDVCNGVSDDVQSLFLATGLSPTAMSLDPEEDITVEWHPFEDAVKMAIDGRITEVCSVAAILRVALRDKTGRNESAKYGRAKY